jgi:hypothetical protein
LSHNSSGAGNASYHKPSHRGTKHLVLQKKFFQKNLNEKTFMQYANKRGIFCARGRRTENDPDIIKYLFPEIFSEK